MLDRLALSLSLSFKTYGERKRDREVKTKSVDSIVVPGGAIQTKRELPEEAELARESTLPPPPPFSFSKSHPVTAAAAASAAFFFLTHSCSVFSIWQKTREKRVEWESKQQQQHSIYGTGGRPARKNVVGAISSSFQNREAFFSRPKEEKRSSKEDRRHRREQQQQQQFVQYVHALIL